MSTDTRRVKTLTRALLPRSVRPRRILFGPLRGTWLVTSWHDYPAGLTGRTERPLLDWLAGHAHAGETWIDVGAHYGYTAFALGRLVGTTGRVFAFEPVSTTAHCLEQGRALNGFDHVKVLPFGLGAPETVEERRLPTTRGMADSTLVRDQHRSDVSMSIARFDWLWSTVCGADPTIHGIKIDVQGMEVEALEGMRNVLRRWRPRLVIELHEGVSRRRILQILGAIGYSPAAVPIDPSPAETRTALLDNKSYVFHAA